MVIIEAVKQKLNQEMYAYLGILKSQLLKDNKMLSMEQMETITIVETLMEMKKLFGALQVILKILQNNFVIQLDMWSQINVSKGTKYWMEKKILNIEVVNHRLYPEKHVKNGTHKFHMFIMMQIKYMEQMGTITFAETQTENRNLFGVILLILLFHGSCAILLDINLQKVVILKMKALKEIKI